MIEVLYEKLKLLHDELNELKKSVYEAKDIIDKTLDSPKVNKKSLKQVSKLLETKENKKLFKGRFLDFDVLVEFLKEKKVNLLVVDAGFESIKQQYIISFLTKKISPLYAIKENLIYGVVPDDKIEEVKKLVRLPFYDMRTSEYDEIELFKILFLFERFDENFDVEKKFLELRYKSSFRNRHFIVFSVEENRVIDFEINRLKKEKSKYEYIFDENYPSLEIMLKKEINNLSFVLMLLEKIDIDMEKIKSSRGLMNVVNRMLNYIEVKINDEVIKKEVKLLRSRLKDY